MIKVFANAALRLTACALLTSCGGGGSAGMPPSSSGGPPFQQHPSNPAQLVYDAEFVAQVLGFPLDANGNVAATVFFAGAQTRIGDPLGLAFDSTGRMYLTEFNAGCTFQGRILVFPAGASGNVAPIADIAGSKTGLLRPWGAAVSAANTLYVSDFFNNSVSAFAPGASGDVSPTLTLSGPHTNISSPTDLAFDPSGKLYVANSFASTITIYAPGASGDTAPIATIGGTQTGLADSKDIAFDSSGNLYALNVNGGFDGSVTVYPPGASGNVAPTATITGPDTGIIGPSGLAVDSAGEVFVGVPVKGEVLVFPAGASGDVTPIRTITDMGFPFQEMQSPEALAIH